MPDFMKQEINKKKIKKKHQMQYNYTRLPVEVDAGRKHIK